MNSADFASNRGEGDWSEEVYISTLLVCLLWCDTCLEWLRNSNLYIKNFCHIFSISPCWCAGKFQFTNALWPVFLAKSWQTMGTPDLNAGASHNRWSAASNCCFKRVLAHGRATLRKFSAVFLSFCTFQKWRFWRTHVWHMCNYCRILMTGWVDPRNSPKTPHFIH